MLIPQEYYTAGTSDDMLDAWDTAAGLLERAGARVSIVSVPHNNYSVVVYAVLSAADVASNMARYDGIEYGRLLLYTFIVVIPSMNAANNCSGSLLGDVRRLHSVHPIVHMWLHHAWGDVSQL